MPLYDYECKDCGRVEEILVMAGDSEPDYCVKCSGDLSRLIGKFKFRLMGKGWGSEGYETVQHK